MIERWLAACAAEDFPRRSPCDGNTKRTHRIVHPGIVGVYDVGAQIAIQPAWAYYHK